MTKKLYFLFFAFCLLTAYVTQAQTPTTTAADKWVDSVMKSLTKDQRIAQLMIVRLSQLDAKTRRPVFFTQQVTQLIQKYNIGGLCVFQGSPADQATIINKMQSIAKTPLMMCIDAEWGVGMRLYEDVLPLPKQMMLGAMRDKQTVYDYGKLVAEQCKRLGLQVNYAPVVDVNNNANNPVINDRSFGEDKYKVADYGIAYMQGMQDNGVMATAKHFPGHGDVAVDSHYDLPVINKSMEELDSLELYPFKEIFAAGVGAVMVAHLYIPAIDNTKNRATSLSPENINGLMRGTMGYQGLTFTDGLEMQGVQKYYPKGAASLQSLIAGNDMLCLPTDVPGTIIAVKNAIKKKQLSWDDINMHCRKVLMAKYMYGLQDLKPIQLNNLKEDLNAGIEEMTRRVAQNAITLVRNEDKDIFPITTSFGKKSLAYIAIGTTSDNTLTRRMKTELGAQVYFYKNSGSSQAIINNAKQYEKVIVGIHSMGRSPGNNFGLTSSEIGLVTALQNDHTATLVFGNPYSVKNFCDIRNLIVCYQDDDIIQDVALDKLLGKEGFRGVLPVTVCPELSYGTGIVTSGVKDDVLQKKKTDFSKAKLAAVANVAQEAINEKATPGCVLFAAKDNNIIYEEAYGYTDYSRSTPVSLESVYDLASLTKVCATTLAVMKLYEEGKIDLNGNLSDYLSIAKGTDKEYLKIKDLLLHQAGLVSYIPFYKTTLFDNAVAKNTIYQYGSGPGFSLPVAKDMFIRDDWPQQMLQEIMASPLGPQGKYVYSDNDFILLGKIIETLSGLPLDKYVEKNFYKPMGLENIAFNAHSNIADSLLIPTEQDQYFRHQLLKGYVHDQGASMFGGVAGHAGLFSNAYNVAALFQMLVNGGHYNGIRFFDSSTVDLFTSYHSSSRRGYGFDKPKRDNEDLKDPYPCESASPRTFGHTGYTGTCVWADPVNKLVYVFLSNRVNPEVSSKLQRLNTREKVHEALYRLVE